MNFKKSFILAAFSLVTYFAFGQSDFKNGFIINNNNETIYGLIDYRNEYVNGNKCVFKADENSEEITYLPGDIIAYQIIDGKYYVTNYIKELDKNVFTELLIDGLVDIFYYKDLNTEYYFIRKGDSELYYLNNEKKEVKRKDVYVKTMNGMTKTSAEFNTKSNQYLGVLRYLFSDSKTTLSKVDMVSLNHKSLIRIAKFYNDEMDPENESKIFVEQLPALIFNLDVLVNANYSGFNVTEYDDYVPYSYDPQVNFSYGLGLTVHPTRFGDKLSFYLQLLYGKNNYSSATTVPGLASYTNHLYSDIDFTYLNGKLGFKYALVKTKLQPEILLGWNYRYTLNSSATRHEDRETVSGTDSYDYVDEIMDVNYNGYYIGLGLNLYQFKKMNLLFNIQYEYMNSNIRNLPGEPSIKINTTRAGIGIRF